jgi:hypothetical protein
MIGSCAIERGRYRTTPLRVRHALVSAADDPLASVPDKAIRFVYQYGRQRVSKDLWGVPHVFVTPKAIQDPNGTADGSTAFLSSAGGCGFPFGREVDIAQAQVFGEAVATVCTD